MSPLRDSLSSLPAVQAEALSGALGWGPPVQEVGSDRRRDVGRAVGRRVEPARLLLAIDDVQCVDADSADALLFAARRLGHDRVAVVMTHRAQERPVVPLEGFHVITLHGLDAAEAHALLGPASRPTSCRGGSRRRAATPWLLRECQRVLSAAQRAGAAPLPAAYCRP
jgi:hypothetical protein